MLILETCFWVMAGCAFYAYLLYPVLLALAVRLRARPPARRAPFAGTVTVVIAAHNEARTIARRVREFADMFKAGSLLGELVVVSDGSTDGTAGVARDAGRNVGAHATRVIELPENSGKAAALTAGCSAAESDIIA